MINTLLWPHDTTHSRNIQDLFKIILYQMTQKDKPISFISKEQRPALFYLGSRESRKSLSLTIYDSGNNPVNKLCGSLRPGCAWLYYTLLRRITILCVKEQHPFASGKGSLHGSALRGGFFFITTKKHLRLKRRC